MRYFLSKQIHNCLASAATGDVFLVKEITKKEIPLGRESFINKELGFSLYYVEEDKTFYLGVKHYSDTAEFKELVTKYEKEGWLKNIPWLTKKKKIYYKAEEKKCLARRIKQGYVIPEWKGNLPAKSFQGGFSDFIFNQEYLQNYLKSSCHGYIGHSVRKKNIDAYIEKKFLSLGRPNLEKLLATWLTSTDGRHFGDSLEGESFNKQKMFVNKSIKKMYNTVFIYSLPEFVGNSSSFNELHTKYYYKLFKEVA